LEGFWQGGFHGDGDDQVEMGSHLDDLVRPIKELRKNLWN
jgi:hypothetical protein